MPATTVIERRAENLEEVYKDLLPELYKQEQEFLSSGGVIQDEYFVSKRGLQCGTRCFTPPTAKQINKVVVFCHGFTDDTRWLETMQFYRLVSKGYSVLAMDFEGHGLTDGDYGVIHDLELVVDDLEEFMESKRNVFASYEWFLLGHSMGGMIATITALRAQEKQNPFKGLILSAPMLKLSGLPPRFITNVLLWFMDVFESKRAPETGNFTLEAICKDVDLGEISLKNPVKEVGSPKLGTVAAFIRVTQKIFPRLKKGELLTPFLVFHGEKDVVTSPKASMELFASSTKASKKELFIDENAFHGMLTFEHKPDLDRYWTKIFTWIDNLDKPPA
eukprot:augustus_masked-scaffold_29-processed-gene-1.10-mRNA-1 protein AED:1.00 eAED:1.00 QI:0/-1/0/0/-1/1/1/0/332